MRRGKNKANKIAPPRPRKDPVRAAAEYGIDIPMLIANLARTPAERVRRHQIALEAFRAFRKAKIVGPLDEINNMGDGRQTHALTVDSLLKARKAIRRSK